MIIDKVVVPEDLQPGPDCDVGGSGQISDWCL